MRAQTFNLLFFLFLFISCEKNDSGSKHESYELSNDNKYVRVKVEKTFNDYNITNSNDQVAFVFQPDPTSNYFYIAGKNIGETNIVVSDKNDQDNLMSISVHIDEYIYVKVPLLDLVYVKKGYKKVLYLKKTDLEIPMISNSDPNIVKHSDFNDKARTVLVEGLNTGESSVCLNNLCWGDSGFYVKVVDNYPVHASWREEDNVTVYENVSRISKPSRLDVLCGNGDYEVLMSDPSVLSCEVDEYSGEFNYPMMESPVTLKVSPLKANANTTLTIRDKDGQTQIFKVTTGWSI